MSNLTVSELIAEYTFRGVAIQVYRAYDAVETITFTNTYPDGTTESGGLVGLTLSKYPSVLEAARSAALGAAIPKMRSVWFTSTPVPPEKLAKLAAMRAARSAK